MEALQRFARQALAHKISRDFAWTFGSFAILAVTGVLLNIVIASTRDAAALGVFNIAYAVYLISAQVATMGLHYSVLRHAAYHQEDAAENGRILCTSMLLALGLGLVFSAAMYAVAPYSTYVFGSDEVAQSIHYAAFGLLLFPFNKVLVSYTNSLRRMKAFSVLQSLRYLTVLAVVSAIAVSDMPFNHATLAFAAAELLTSLCCVAYLLRAGLMHHLQWSRRWMRTHLSFGSKAVMAGIFLDLNTRLDVLILGMMLSDHAVGIYSFAALLVDGVQHILAIMRVNFNPILVKALRDGDHSTAMRMLRLSKRFVTLGTAALCFCLVAGFLIAVHWLIPDKGLVEGLPSLLILVTGFTVLSGFAPFDNLLMISGHPAHQTAQAATVTGFNVLLCLSLVPHLGIEGAAIATVAGYLAGTGILLYCAPRLTGWNLLRNRFVR